EPGQCQLSSGGAAARLVGALVDPNLQPRASERDGGGEPVRPRPDDDGVELGGATAAHEVSPGSGSASSVSFAPAAARPAASGTSAASRPAASGPSARSRSAVDLPRAADLPSAR